MIFFAPWRQTSAWINHPRNIAVVLITVLTLSASLLLSAGDSAAQTSTSWSYCASEGGQCNFSGTREVRYGANGNYAYGIFSNGVSCNNGVFGDPLSGIVKECQFGDGASQSSSSTQDTSNTSWSYCASEGGQCNFSGTREVRYGANGTYAYGIFSNGVSCNNGVFGDPLSGIVKECQYGDGTSQSSSSSQNNPAITIRHGATAPARAANVTSLGPGKSVTAPTVIIPMAYSPTAPTVTTACLAIPYMATLRPARLKMARRNPRQPRPTRSAHRQPQPIRRRVIMSAKTAATRIAAHRRGVHPLPS